MTDYYSHLIYFFFFLQVLSFVAQVVYAVKGNHEASSGCFCLNIVLMFALCGASAMEYYYVN